MYSEAFCIIFHYIYYWILPKISHLHSNQQKHSERDKIHTLREGERNDVSLLFHLHLKWKIFISMFGLKCE